MKDSPGAPPRKVFPEEAAESIRSRGGPAQENAQGRAFSGGKWPGDMGVRVREKVGLIAAGTPGRGPISRGETGPSAAKRWLRARNGAGDGGETGPLTRYQTRGLRERANAPPGRSQWQCQAD